MFNSGLLSTFIPEILMILGYIFCLVSPNFNKENKVIEAKEIAVSLENQRNKTVLATYYFSDHVIIESLIPEKQEAKSYSETQLKFDLENFNTALSDEFDFKQFSRPPPAYC